MLAHPAVSSLWHDFSRETCFWSSIVWLTIGCTLALAVPIRPANGAAPPSTSSPTAKC